MRAARLAMITAVPALVLAGGAGAAQVARVPSVSRDAATAYRQLHRAGFRVTIARLQLGGRSSSFAVGTSPRRGTKLATGSTVTLQVSCCRAAALRAARRRRTYVVPNFLGRGASGAITWAAGRAGIDLELRLAALRDSDSPTLASAYTVTAQDPTAKHKLGVPAGHTEVLIVRASPPVAPPPLCGVPRGATLLAGDAQALLYTVTASAADGAYSTEIEACLRGTRTVQRLGGAGVDDGYSTTLSGVALAGDIGALSFVYEDKYQNCNSYLQEFDLKRHTGGQIFNAGCANGLPVAVDSLQVSPGGAAAWRTETRAAELPAVYDVSCPAAAACYAVDSDGALLQGSTSDDAPWSRALVASTRLAGIDCPSADLCVATAGDHVVSSRTPADTTSWSSTPVGVEGMRRIACPSAALCVAPDSTGALVSRDPTAGATAWHEVPFSLGTTEPASVSCTAGGFCAVGGGHGLAISADPADPTSWRVLSVPGDWPISSVSCPSAALCLVGRYDGSVLATTDPTDPSPAFTPVYSPVNGYDAAPIWCSPSTGCVASAEGGEVVRSSDPARPGSWSLTHVDSAAERIEAYACPPVGACIAVDSAGGALTPTDGESWPRTTIDLPPPCSAPACENEAVYLRDATGVHEVDSVSAGSETDLSGLRLSDATLTWTHQGTTRSVPVR